MIVDEVDDGALIHGSRSVQESFSLLSMTVRTSVDHERSSRVDPIVEVQAWSVPSGDRRTWRD